MQKAGVAIHAITAETGGDVEIKKRLAERETVLGYPVHGDPDHHLLVRRKEASGAAAKASIISAEDIPPDPTAEPPTKADIADMRASLEEFFQHSLVEKPITDLRGTTEEEAKAASPDGDEHDSLYIMVEHKATKYGGTYEDYMMIQPALIVVDKTGKLQQVWSWNTPPLDKVHPKIEMTSVKPAGGLVLVGVRPLTPDLLASIKENRNVKISGKTMWQIAKEMMAQMSKDSMSGSLSRLFDAMTA